MLTPQDIQNKEFSKSVFGGYEVGSVDDFLEELTEYYASLYKDNAILKSKMKVLVEKVEEYRSTEDAMRMALLTAQNMADDLKKNAQENYDKLTAEAQEKHDALIADAESKSADMLKCAEEKSKAELAKIDALTRFENDRLQKAEKNSADYIEIVRKITEKQLDFLARLSELKAEPVEMPEVPVTEEKPAEPTEEEKAETSREAKEQEILDTAKEIDKNLSSSLEEHPVEPVQEKPAQTTENIENTRIFRRKKGDIDWDDDDEPTSPRPKFDFSDLKFGKNFGEDDK